MKKQPVEARHSAVTTSAAKVRNVWWPAMLSAIALWAAFAPLRWDLLGWIAPAGWIWLAGRQEVFGRREYVILWLAGCFFWLATLQGIRLAFWPLYFGWFALSLYLAVYVPLSVGLTRLLCQRLKWPFGLSAALAWTAMEQTRSCLLSGYGANLLSHTQAYRPLVIQISDQIGALGLSFFMILVLALLVESLTARNMHSKPIIGRLVIASLVLVGIVLYGKWRIKEADGMLADQPALARVLLIQENTPTMFEANAKRMEESWLKYLSMTREAYGKYQPVDMIVWPESTFTNGVPWFELDLSEGLPDEAKQRGHDTQSLNDFRNERLVEFEAKTRSLLRAVHGTVNETNFEEPHFILGCDTVEISSHRVGRLNSALFLSPSGETLDVYHKRHLVMFGEYIPLGSALAWLGNMFGFENSFAGEEFKIFNVEGVRYATNICFESMVPRFTARQVRELMGAGQSPDVLVNITNDSWFRGSSMLDHHLATTIFGAVENRRPVLVAGNTGLSASIDGAGRVLAVTQRNAGTCILAEPKRDSRVGLVQIAGYPLAWIAVVACGIGLGLSRAGFGCQA
ncbi:MAG: apolipoprotein N-acyltransferase [Planctomycetales bacterium]|nr:apolipoprotein N-acyltransferase [Planctomycetales bacterium]